ncbi:MAG: hypothetical protein GF317_24055 [Candidatus Lokiarchaeota archaeon]|nr:hypothetical protein [Candidatus Lokiarchaeota archaeon]MBD3202447.1 hypothetical protein [Candidatus Lokiarchaeota archaeon]
MESSDNSLQRAESNELLKDIGLSLDSGLVKSLFSQIYPRKIIKRFSFQKTLGMYYPFIDIWTPFKEPQFSLFYDKISISFGPEKLCVRCEKAIKAYKSSTQQGFLSKPKDTSKPNKSNKSKKLKKSSNSSKFQSMDSWMNNNPLNAIPVSLCLECQENIYFEYHQCVYSIVKKTFSKLNNLFISKQSRVHSSTEKEFQLCKTLLNPSCGLKLKFDHPTPCLRNHGIGLILADTNIIQLIIAPLESLKYRMIYEGGFLGIILGYSNRILNVEQLEPVMDTLTDTFSDLCDKLNIKLINEFLQTEKSSGKPSNPFCPSNRSEENILLLVSQYFRDRSNSLHNIQFQTFLRWLIVKFLSFYDSKEIKSLLNDFFEGPINILRQLIDSIEEGTDLQILDYIELISLSPPIKASLRELMEKDFRQVFNKNPHIKKSIKDHGNQFNFVSTINSVLKLSEEQKFNVSSELVSALQDSIGVFSPQNFEEIYAYQEKEYSYMEFFDEKADSDIIIDIYEIYSSIGPFVIANTNLSMRPTVINIKDLIGRMII